MKSKPPRTIPAASHLKQRATACALGCMLALSACGGGGGGSPSASNGVGVGGTGSAAGPVTGFGSIIVNGVRFEDNTAAIYNDDDRNTALAPSTVKLGMQVEVQSGAITDDISTGLQKASASQIVYGSSLKGQVMQAPDTVNRTLTVLGQTISIPADTVFSGYVNGLNSVQNGDIVEIHAFLGSNSGAYTATRVEKLGSLDKCKLIGVVSSANSSTLTIGALSVNYSGVSSPPALTSLSTGNPRVKVELTVNAGACTNVATRLTLKSIALPDSTRSELAGIVSGFVSITNFKVNGVSVLAPGNTTLVANGNSVEVEGSTQGGVLTASKVEVKSGVGTEDIRLFGAAINWDSANKRFDLQGVSVDYTTATLESGLTESNFGDGTKLEVRGALNASGTRVIATRIKPKS